MSAHAKTTGTSAVNDEGFVVIFCADPGVTFERFEVEGNEVALVSDTDEFAHVRTYGNLTIETLRSGGELHVQTILSDGSEGPFYRIGGIHGR